MSNRASASSKQMSYWNW